MQMELAYLKSICPLMFMLGKNQRAALFLTSGSEILTGDSVRKELY